MLSPTLETERLILRRYKESDIDMQYEILTDERLHKFITLPKYTKEEELEYLKRWIEIADIDKCERWVITLKDKDIPIGNISVNSVNKKNNYCNVGYVLLYNYWGYGYATEALTAVSDYLLDSGYYLVESNCNELNTSSSKVMIKSGFKKDGYVANRRINQDGTYSGIEYYSKNR